MRDPLADIARAVYRGKLRSYSGTPEGDRFLDGARLYDLALRWTLAGMQSEFPELDSAAIMRKYRERLALARRLEQRA